MDAVARQGEGKEGQGRAMSSNRAVSCGQCVEMGQWKGGERDNSLRRAGVEDGTVEAIGGLLETGLIKYCLHILLRGCRVVVCQRELTR